MAKLHIPRCLKPTAPSTRATYFADASEQRFGAVSYIRVADPGEHLHCSMTMAKAKLAPLKATTVRRLELMGARGRDQT